jgi:DnaK suppressor protein
MAEIQWGDKMKKKNTPKQDNTSDVAKWKKVLQEERQKMLVQIKNVEQGVLKQSQRDAAGDLSGYSLHMADAGTDSFNRDISLAQATNEQRIVFQIDEALERIKEGIYGICPSCEKPIKKARLKAVPYARLCIQCKSKEEARPETSGRA